MYIRIEYLWPSCKSEVEEEVRDKLREKGAGRCPGMGLSEVRTAEPVPWEKGWKGGWNHGIIE